MIWYPKLVAYLLYGVDFCTKGETLAVRQHRIVIERTTRREQ